MVIYEYISMYIYIYSPQVHVNNVVHLVTANAGANQLNPFMPTVPTFAVRETDVSRTVNVERNGGQKWVNNTDFPMKQ